MSDLIRSFMIKSNILLLCLDSIPQLPANTLVKESPQRALVVTLMLNACFKRGTGVGANILQKCDATTQSSILFPKQGYS